MSGELVLTWEMILYLLIAVFYFQLMRYLDRRYFKKREVTDEEYLWTMARELQCSEYDIFHMAAKQWHISGKKIEDDFKAYLVDMMMPYYVKDFIRKSRGKTAADQ